jgi:spermidine/putrescine transport system ATP-binding protein
VTSAVRDTDSDAVAPVTMADPVPVVRLEGVSKRFGEALAVDRVDLDIANGEFFSLLGPSGCGKSTTLAIIGGFEEPTEGTVYLGGREMRRVPPYRRDVNTVFQSYALFPHLDVAANVGFGLRRRKLARDAIRRRVADALDLVGLAGLEKRKPGQLSGGQQQRVALARALVNEPRVLLLDEPLGALDLKLRKQMQLELKRIQREVGVTFLYVTHDQEEALAMSDRLAVMNGGRIEQIGVPEEVYDRPATEFVAEFLGASNLLPGRVSAEQAGLVRISLDDAGEVQVPAARVPPGSGRVKVGVRPEKLRPVRPGAPDPGGENEIGGRVRTSTYLGLGHQLEVDGPGGASLTVYVQNAGEGTPGAGESVRLCWRPEHTFVVQPAEPAEGGREA